MPKLHNKFNTVKTDLLCTKADLHKLKLHMNFTRAKWLYRSFMPLKHAWTSNAVKMTPSDFT